MSTTTTSLDLLAQIRELRDELDRMRRDLAVDTSIELSAGAARVFLGQPVAVTARVLALPGAEPVARVPVTFIATAGLLRPTDSPSALPSASLTLTTGADGRARVTHVPSAAQGLTDDEQHALEGALALLDPSSRSPADAAEALQSLAHAYRWDVASELRAAVDRYADTHGLRADRLPPPEVALSWSSSESGVLTLVHRDTRNGSAPSTAAVAATASIAFRVLNWVPAFLSTLRAMLRSEEDLQNRLRTLIDTDAPSAGNIADGVLGRMDEYLSGAHGLAGKLVAADALQNALTTFVERDISRLPAETRADLGTRLTPVRRATIGGGGTFVPTLAGAAAAGKAIRTSADEFDRIGAGKLHDFTDRLGAAADARERTLADSLDRVGAGKLQDFTSQVNAAADGRGRTLAAEFDRLGTGKLQDFTDRLGTAADGRGRTLAAEFDQIGTAKLQDFTTQIGTAADTRTRTLTADFDRLGTARLQDFTTQIGTVAETRTRTLTVDLDRIGTAKLQDFNTQIGTAADTRTRTLTADFDRLGTARLQDFSTQISTAADTRTRTFTESLTQSSGDALRAHTATLGDAGTQALGDFRTAATRETGVALENARTQIAGQTSRAVDGLNSEATRLRTGLGDQVNQNIAEFRRNVSDRLDQLERNHREVFTPGLSAVRADTDRNTRTITDLSTSSTRHDAQITTLNTQVARKTDADTFTTFQTETRTSLNNKVDATEFRDTNTRIDRRVGGLENNVVVINRRLPPR